MDKGFYDIISYMLTNGEYDKLKHEVRKLFDRWIEEGTLQLHIESELRQILIYVRKFALNNSNERSYDVEASLDQALCYALNIDELFDKFWSIVENLVSHNEIRNAKLDSPEFLSLIKDFLKGSISEHHSMPSVCKHFYLSQTYLNKLFRKYEHTSFNEYLTKLRICEAKEIMTRKPEIPLKDVASFVGYNDPFYFSKVFKSIVGVPPSDFKSSEKSV